MVESSRSGLTAIALSIPFVLDRARRWLGAEYYVTPVRDVQVHTWGGYRDRSLQP